MHVRKGNESYMMMCRDLLMVYGRTIRRPWVGKADPPGYVCCSVRNLWKLALVQRGYFDASASCSDRNHCSITELAPRS